MHSSRKEHELLKKEARTAYFFVLPSIIVIAGIAFIPIFKALSLSLYLKDLTFPQVGTVFVGLANYSFILRDSNFWQALFNTIFFTVVCVSLEFILGLAIALWVNRPFTGRGLMRAAILIPWAIPTVVSAQMWRWIFNDKAGILNHILKSMHLITDNIPWLSSVATARFCIIIADVWKTTPFMALLLIAGLQLIPEELYEAALVDGASSLKRFWSITLPLLKPVVLVACLFRTLDTFRIFDLVYVLTGGAFKTETLSVLTADVTFRCSDYGSGSALAVIMFLCVVIISFIFIKILGTKVND